MKFKTNTLNRITLVQFNEKLDVYLAHVLQSSTETGKYSFTFIDGTVGVFVKQTVKNNFIHYCESFAQGRSCVHNACAFAVMEKLGEAIDRFGLPDRLEETNEIIGELHQYININHKIGLPALKETSALEAGEESAEIVSSSPKSEKPAPTTRQWANEWEEIEKFLLYVPVSRGVIAKVKEKRKDIFRTVLLTPMTSEPVKPGTPYLGTTLERAIKHILLGKSLLLIGSKGSGKDTLTSTLAWIFGYPMYLQTGHKGYTAETLVGDNFPTGEGLKIEFKYSAYATCVIHGGLVHFAELNMLLPDATSIFHSVYDGNQQLSTPYGTENKHPHHLLIASINVGEHYAGIKALNSALKDRMAVINMPATIDLKELIITKTGFTDDVTISWMLKIKQEIDKLYVQDGIGDESRTIRGYLDAAAYFLEFGVSDESKIVAIEDNILNKTEDAEDRFAIRNRLRITCWDTLPKLQEEIELEIGAA